MIKKGTQISLTMELEGSVLLRKDIRCKTVLLTKVINTKNGPIPMKDKQGRIIKEEHKIVKEIPVYGKAYKHINLPWEFVENCLNSPLKGYKLKSWMQLPDLQRVGLHIVELCSENSAKLHTFSLIS